MKQLYLNSGTYTYKPLKGKLDVEAYILAVLAKDTCCTKNIFADAITTGSITEGVAGEGVTIEEVLLKDGGILANSMYAGFYPTASSQALSGAGAANVTSFHTRMTSTGAAQAVTLADGTQIGQLKKLTHVVDGGSIVLTPANLAAGTTITFTSVGEFAVLIWQGTEWYVLEIGNTATPGTLPAIA